MFSKSQIKAGAERAPCGPDPVELLWQGRRVIAEIPGETKTGPRISCKNSMQEN